MTCIIPNPRQPDYSTATSGGSMAGNIGIVRAKVLIWDHDPLLARPMQKLSHPFSQITEEQLRERISDLQFMANSAFLSPRYIPHDMFIATKRQTGTKDVPQENGTSVAVPVFGLDFVGSPQSGSGQIAFQKLPPSIGVPGKDYTSNGTTNIQRPNGDFVEVFNWRFGRDMFPHQVWIHVGSLLKRGVPLHPSEYKLNESEVSAIKNMTIGPPTSNCAYNEWTIEEIHSAVRWDYAIMEDGAGHRAIAPVQISKPPEDTTAPIHWTLEKFTPVFQGEDFFVVVERGEKDLINVEDTNAGGDCIDTNWADYKYLIYDPAVKPGLWVDGISNAAFYIEREKTITNSVTVEQSSDPRRDRYWWKYKSYLLIEIGAGDPNHNYFIEIVKGRNPRLLHLGSEWDNPKRLQEGGSTNSEDFTYMRKCRELGVFEAVSSDELFKKKDFKVAVRNHLGRFIITFEGYEGTPWEITRLDNDPSKYNYTKILVPMIVPAGKIRLHGGNMSVKINFAPIEYVNKVTVPFTDRQADTGEAENKDLYMTFSHMGNSIQYTNPVVKNKFFSDKRLGYGKVGYDCDAYYTQEVIKNTYRQIDLYKSFNAQYRKYGKGWVYERPPTIDDQQQIDPITGLVGRHNLINGVDSANGGNPHRLEIINLRSQNQTFKFGLDEDSDASYPYKEFASRWDVGVRLTAGSVMMPIVQGDDEVVIDGNARKKIFFNVVTPIATSWSLIVLGGGKPIQDNVESIDISELVSSINDSWSADDFTCINHEMNMRCYIPLGVPVGGDPNKQAEAARPDLHALGQKVLKLIDKACYVTVSYWWENGVGKRDAVGNKIPRSGSPYDSELLIQMTGIAYGASIERSANLIFMDFRILDYMSVFQKQLIFNSPFFDGVADIEAVYELAKMAHLDDDRDKTSGIDRRPLGFLQKVIDDGDRIGDGKFIYNGETSICRRFDLPGTYATIANPAVKFQNGETYDSAIKKIAQQAAKVVYFDRWGVLRFENIPAIEAAFASGGKEKFKPVYEFRTTPFNFSGTTDAGSDVTQNRFVFDPDKHAAHLVYNVVSYNRSVEDCVNQIVLLTASNDIQLADGSRTGGFIIEGYTFFEQIWDPNAEGFLGFRKPFYQSNGIFGGIEGIRNGLLQYAKMKFPPASISIQTYGVPGLKALDIISVDDNLFYITEIAHEIDPVTNNWWMTISGEWLKQFGGELGFLEHRGETDSGGEEGQ